MVSWHNRSAPHNKSLRFFAINLLVSNRLSYSLSHICFLSLSLSLSLALSLIISYPKCSYQFLYIGNLFIIESYSPSDFSYLVTNLDAANFHFVHASLFLLYRQSFVWAIIVDTDICGIVSILYIAYGNVI